MINGSEKVTEALRRFISNFHSHADDFGDAIATSVEREVANNPGILTGRFISALPHGIWSQMVDTDHSNVLVGAMVANPDVFYDGFLEFDTANRDGSTRAGRKYYERGILGADFEKVVGEIAQASFVI